MHVAKYYINDIHAFVILYCEFIVLHITLKNIKSLKALDLYIAIS